MRDVNIIADWDSIITDRGSLFLPCRATTDAVLRVSGLWKGSRA